MSWAEALKDVKAKINEEQQRLKTEDSVGNCFQSVRTINHGGGDHEIGIEQEDQGFGHGD